MTARHFPTNAHSRRDFLLRSALVGAGAAAAYVGMGALPALAVRDYTTRAAFDEIDLAFNGGAGQTAQNNENGALGWGESYFLQGYVLMYEATGDTYYLDKVIAHADLVLANRDSVRGVLDYRGLSLPAWRCTGSYTSGSIDLVDSLGRPSLQVRTVSRPADDVSVQVGMGTGGIFNLVVRNPAAGAAQNYTDLTMVQGGSNYAVTRLNDVFASSTHKITAKDLRPTPAAADKPAPAPETAMAAQPYIFAVQTGQITYPLARFVRLVKSDPVLLANPTYAAKANDYQSAVECAIAVHDFEFVTNGTEGHYIWPKGAPAVFDGADQPHNQYLSLARTMIEMYAVNGNTGYLDKLVKMATRFQNDLRVDGAGSYVWDYFCSTGLGYNGWTAAQNISEYQPVYAGYTAIEDTNHGFIDVSVPIQMVRDGLGAGMWNTGHLTRFGSTAINKILAASGGVESTKNFVDGSGALAFRPLAAAYGPLNAQQSTLFPRLTSMFNQQQPVATGSPGTILGTANLVRLANP